MFEFTTDDYERGTNTLADAIRMAAAANARLNALRRAFSQHEDANLIEHAVWTGHEAPTPEQSVSLYEKRWNRMSAYRRKKYLKAVKPHLRAAQIYA